MADKNKKTFLEHLSGLADSVADRFRSPNSSAPSSSVSPPLSATELLAKIKSDYAVEIASLVQKAREADASAISIYLQIDKLITENQHVEGENGKKIAAQQRVIEQKYQLMTQGTLTLSELEQHAKKVNEIVNKLTESDIVVVRRNQPLALQFYKQDEIETAIEEIRGRLRYIAAAVGVFSKKLEVVGSIIRAAQHGRPAPSSSQSPTAAPSSSSSSSQSSQSPAPDIQSSSDFSSVAFLRTGAKAVALKNIKSDYFAQIKDLVKQAKLAHASASAIYRELSSLITSGQANDQKKQQEARAAGKEPMLGTTAHLEAIREGVNIQFGIITTGKFTLSQLEQHAKYARDLVNELKEEDLTDKLGGLWTLRLDIDGQIKNALESVRLDTQTIVSTRNYLDEQLTNEKLAQPNSIPVGRNATSESSDDDLSDPLSDSPESFSGTFDREEMSELSSSDDEDGSDDSALDLHGGGELPAVLNRNDSDSSGDDADARSTGTDSSGSSVEDPENPPLLQSLSPISSPKVNSNEEDKSNEGSGSDDEQSEFGEDSDSNLSPEASSDDDQEQPNDGEAADVVDDNADADGSQGEPRESSDDKQDMPIQGEGVPTFSTPPHADSDNDLSDDSAESSLATKASNSDLGNIFANDLSSSPLSPIPNVGESFVLDPDLYPSSDDGQGKASGNSGEVVDFSDVLSTHSSSDSSPYSSASNSSDSDLNPRSDDEQGGSSEGSGSGSASEDSGFAIDPHVVSRHGLGQGSDSSSHSSSSDGSSSDSATEAHSSPVASVDIIPVLGTEARTNSPLEDVVNTSPNFGTNSADNVQPNTSTSPEDPSPAVEEPSLVIGTSGGSAGLGASDRAVVTDSQREQLLRANIDKSLEHALNVTLDADRFVKAIESLIPAAKSGSAVREKTRTGILAVVGPYLEEARQAYEVACAAHDVIASQRLAVQDVHNPKVLRAVDRHTRAQAQIAVEQTARACQAMEHARLAEKDRLQQRAEGAMTRATRAVDAARDALTFITERIPTKADNDAERRLLTEIEDLVLPHCVIATQALKDAQRAHVDALTQQKRVVGHESTLRGMRAAVQQIVQLANVAEKAAISAEAQAREVSEKQVSPYAEQVVSASVASSSSAGVSQEEAAREAAIAAAHTDFLARLHEVREALGQAILDIEQEPLEALHRRLDTISNMALQLAFLNDRKDLAAGYAQLQAVLDDILSEIIETASPASEADVEQMLANVQKRYNLLLKDINDTLTSSQLGDPDKSNLKARLADITGKREPEGLSPEDRLDYFEQRCVEINELSQEILALKAAEQAKLQYFHEYPMLDAYLKALQLDPNVKAALQADLHALNQRISEPKPGNPGARLEHFQGGVEELNVLTTRVIAAEAAHKAAAEAAARQAAILAAAPVDARYKQFRVEEVKKGRAEGQVQSTLEVDGKWHVTAEMANNRVVAGTAELVGPLLDEQPELQAESVSRHNREDKHKSPKRQTIDLTRHGDKVTTLLTAGAKHLPESSKVRLAMQALKVAGKVYVKIMPRGNNHDTHVKVAARAVLAAVQVGLLPIVSAEMLDAIHDFYINPKNSSDQDKIRKQGNWNEISDKLPGILQQAETSCGVAVVYQAYHEVCSKPVAGLSASAPAPVSSSSSFFLAVPGSSSSSGASLREAYAAVVPACSTAVDSLADIRSLSPPI